METTNMESIPMSVLVLAPLSAITLHELVLRRVEVDHLALPLIVTSSTIYWALVYYIGFFSATVVTASFWIPLWLYIATYRAFFHPLKDYPGPLGAKLSSWWAVKQTWASNFHYHRVQQQLQKEYGDYVRTGPRELSIFDPAAVQPIMGFQSRTTKGPFYDVMEKSLHLNRDKVFHRQRRRIWDNAMKTSLSDFAPHIEMFTDQLITRLREEEGKAVPLLEYVTYYSYDVMAALAFGKPMGFITGQSSDVAESILSTFTRGVNALGLMYHMPWLMNALGVLTSIAGPMREWRDFSVNQMKARMALKDARPDLISHLINNTANNESGHNLLYGESRLIISAGSETVSSALTFVFMHLAVYPSYMHAIRKEYRKHEAEYNCERPLPLLDAVIQESMRLWPSVLFASQRVTPPEGLTINGHFIPGNMIINMPPFTIYRDPRNFVDPDSFIPERWTDRPDLVLDKSAFHPFSTGPYSCAGKGLAMMELRSVVGRVLDEFDIVLPEGFVSEHYFEDIKEHFTAGPPRLLVQFVSTK
ncbi:cytochrome P450 [Cucurbitaria berberidis CBS 394.84]|uniref:Cytochrome P450 n=1 Tax=Cucurbitaria berberidis CBS 394.84 TaxID=1168544 RepID=A0A9P4G803_9PLEO|nr:cytochrome P450 [Cucurbitaria berberidis CBS 394.84]KAF1840748.1 cytochrome P450 [Cucurbitaria berberidis CBS 394.84]